MNSYDLANRLEEFYKGTHIEKAAETLRQQADRIAELEKQTKPLSDEEIEQIAIRYYVGSRILPIQYARAIEERHGIK